MSSTQFIYLMIVLDIVAVGFVIALGYGIYGDPFDFNRTWPLWVLALLGAGIVQSFMSLRVHPRSGKKK